jgi:hypothetical protein
MEETPASLLERLRRRGEQAAWAHFVDLYTPLLYYWARRIGLQPHDAADLVQGCSPCSSANCLSSPTGRLLRLR